MKGSEHMYSVAAYGSMINDSIRMNAFKRALQQDVFPGAVVLDIGTGTGIMAMLACKYGAGKVYAIEPDSFIQTAKSIAKANGFADRIEFIQGLSTSIDLPQKADVIVSDLCGVLPFFTQNIPSIIDARNRLLAPGGKLISRRMRLWTALVESPRAYSALVDPWMGSEFDLSAARRIVVNSWKKGKLSAEDLVSEPNCWATIDYATVENPNVSAESILTPLRAGTIHGAVVWFDAELAPGITFSNSLVEPELIYGRAFFPFVEPVAVELGDRVKLEISANLIGGDYVWRWNTRVLEGGVEGAVKAKFSQSTFYGSAISVGSLAKRSNSYIPRLSRMGEIEKYILSLMDGKASSTTIAELVSKHFAEEFPDFNSALTKVGDLCAKYAS